MKSETKKELQVIALLDGRPGHEKQTMGIIHALQLRVPVKVIRIDVSSFSLFDAFKQTCRLFLSSSGLTHPQISKGDFLIGTGSGTHLPMLLYKRKYAIPAITCMSPAMHLRKYLDLCFVPEHDRAIDADNIMITAGAPNCSVNKRNHRKECGLILLGGIDTKSHYWDSQQVAQMVEKVIKNYPQKHWTVSSSPRTPEDMLVIIRQIEEKYHNFRFFDYRNTPPGWIEEQYDKNSLVWVTADSISMIYEAITAGCTVGIFPMQWVRENSKFKRNENVLLEKRLVTPFGSWEKNGTIQAHNKELNEAQRCADWILQKWWPTNLQ